MIKWFCEKKEGKKEVRHAMTYLKYFLLVKFKAWSAGKDSIIGIFLWIFWKFPKMTFLGDRLWQFSI